MRNSHLRISSKTKISTSRRLLYICKYGCRYGGYNQPVVAFGASYGGQLATYMRLKYPHIVFAAVSSSGPVGCFPGLHPPYDTSSYWQVVTRDATEAGGSTKFCAQNVQNAFTTLFEMQGSDEGRKNIESAFNLCEALKDENDVLQLAYVVQGAFDALAMFNYPFPMFGTPGYPFRVACEFLADEKLQGLELLEALANANWVFYHNRMQDGCLNLVVGGPAAGNEQWEYLTCTEMMPQEQPYWPTNGITDMFWDQGNFTAQDIDTHCMSKFEISPRRNWAAIEYGGKNLKWASNIVFYNGLLDPWSSGGVLEDLSDTLIAVVVPMGAHVADIWGEQPNDTPSLKAARETEMEYIWKWVMEPQMQSVLQI